MDAKEMFKKIGYEFYDHNYFDVKSNTLIPQDEPYIEYSEQSFKGEEHIKFCPYSHLVTVESFAYIGGERFRIPAPLNIDELKAITKQCEELGWLKNDKR